MFKVEIRELNTICNFNFNKREKEKGKRRRQKVEKEGSREGKRLKFYCVGDLVEKCI